MRRTGTNLIKKGKIVRKYQGLGRGREESEGGKEGKGEVGRKRRKERTRRS